MSEILIETENPTNLKPDSWYKEDEKLYGGQIQLLKEKDISVDKGRDYKVMDQSATRFFDEYDIHSINTLEGNQYLIDLN